MKIKFEPINIEKILLQFYFICFILLNVVDFFNLLPTDLDFFKKILSWILIGYVFYRVSLTKIFIGKKVKSYDLALILAFCMFTIPKALVLYVTNISINNVIPKTYVVFNSFLSLILDMNSNFFLSTSFVIGLVFTLIISISMLLNNDFSKKSLIGSFNFKEGYFKYFYQQFLLSFFLVFFGLIIFNFFMEWFALAVDSQILVMGLIYYLFVYVHNHGKGKISQVLKNISNAGNNFYQRLIEMFCDKKYVFVGISFLLTVHLLVDIGVYLIPYTIGTENSLYFNSLDAQGREHIPLFSLIDLKQSQFYSDITNSYDIDFWLAISVTVIYFASLASFYAFMLLPFFIFYKNSQKRKVRFKRYIAIVILSISIFIIMFSFLSYIDIFNSGVKLPIGIAKPLSSQVKGVDVYTSSIFTNDNANLDAFSQLLSALIFFCAILMFLLFKYQKYKYFFDKLILIMVLLFFIYYIFIFYTSIIEVEMSNIKDQVSLGQNYHNSLDNYNNAIKFYDNESMFKYRGVMNFENDAKTLQAKVFAFSNLEQMTPRSVKYDENHDDYLLFEVINYEKDVRVEFSDFENVYLGEENYNLNSMKFSGENIKFIYYLGENYFDLEKVNDKEYLVKLNIEEDTIDSFIKFPNHLDILLLESMKYIEYIRLFFTSIFYVFGMVAFSYYYVKENLF